MKNRLAVFALVFLSGFSSRSQTNEIPFIEENLTIDGSLDEKVWEQLPIYSNFNNYFPDDIGKASNDTEVKVFHNRNCLYISATYNDTTSESMISSLKRDDFGGIVLDSDNFQVVIDTYNKKSNGYFFCVNASNAQLDGLVSFNDTEYDMNQSWSAVWQSKTKIEGTKKIFEIAIPLKALNFDPENTVWGLNFILRDNKANNWMTWTDMSRNYFQHDLRTTDTFKIEHLPKATASKFVVIPSVSYNFLNDVKNDATESNFRPSLDVQYSITPSLKLDVTINPDFSQIDVDRQVTNLTRFALFFPERRNFFIENSDLFTNLGTYEVSPFYSRRIGASNNILFGLKLSGNIASKTRIGVLNVQTDKSEAKNSDNFGVLVLQQQLSKRFAATGFLVNRQETSDLNFTGDFNRVAGINVNYKSENNKWTGAANFGKCFSDSLVGENSFYRAGINYSSKELEGGLSFLRVSKNYITEVGFNPRLYNYDALNDVITREGFSKSRAEIRFLSYPEESKKIQTIHFYPSNTTYLDEVGAVSQSQSTYSQAFWFKNASSIYLNLSHNYVDLKYAFDPLGNGNEISPNTYNYGDISMGYYSVNNRKVSFDAGLTLGSYFEGGLSSVYARTSYRFLPIAKIGLDYELNYLDLKQLGNRAFHLLQFKGEVFLNNRLNWTTYLQYNTQRNNFNINSRIQWEYKPLSYVYLVISDNYDEYLERSNWSVAFKVNYRFDF